MPCDTIWAERTFYKLAVARESERCWYSTIDKRRKSLLHVEESGCMSSSLQTQQSSQRDSLKLTWLAFEDLRGCWKIHNPEMIKHWWSVQVFPSPLQVDNLTVNMRTYLVGYCRDGLRHVSNATGRRGESTSCGLWHTWQLCIITEQHSRMKF